MIFDRQLVIEEITRTRLVKEHSWAKRPWASLESHAPSSFIYAMCLDVFGIFRRSLFQDISHRHLTYPCYRAFVILVCITSIPSQDIIFLHMFGISFGSQSTPKWSQIPTPPWKLVYPEKNMILLVQMHQIFFCKVRNPLLRVDIRSFSGGS